jgi:hypothetical protein
VQNILTAHVQPLLDIGVAVPTNSDRSRAFVVVRIPQSPLAPHTVDGGAIYIRTGNRNHPEQQATVDQIEWLLNNRSRATALRQRLLGQALQRSKTMGEPVGAVLTLSLCPTYPSEPFRDPRQMVALYRQIRVRDYYNTADSYPIAENARTVQDAVIGVKAIQDVGAYWYAELNTRGLYLTRQTLLETLWPQEPEDDAAAGRPDLIRAPEIVARTDQFVRSSEIFYDAINYRGPLEFGMRVENADHYALDALLDPRGWRGRGRLPECPDAEIVLDLRVSGMILAQERRRVVLDSIARVGHAYNVNFPVDYVERFLARESGLPLVA